MKDRLKKAFSDAPCHEENIIRTIRISEKAFAESRSRMSYFEFLYTQLRFIHKRWWILQAVLLLSTGFLLQWMERDFGIRRCLGIAAPLFAVLILPELWKNRSFDAMEIEGTTFYTLRQIYAARITLFAGMDVLLISFFYASASANAVISLWELTTEFLLPFCISCCICLHCLYHDRSGSEIVPLFLCFVWASVWLLIVLDDRIYSKISALGWSLLLAAAISFLAYSILRGQKSIQTQWEAKPIWN